MADITYGTPPGGGYQATVSGAPGFGSTGGPWGNMGWLQALARKSAENKLKQQEMDLYARKRAMNAQMRAENFGGRNPQSELQRFNEARDYMDRMENPLDRYTSGNSNLGSNFRNFTGASDLSGIGGGFQNPWEALYGAAAGNPSAQAVGEAGENWRAKLALDNGMPPPQRTGGGK